MATLLANDRGLFELMDAALGKNHAVNSENRFETGGLFLYLLSGSSIIHGVSEIDQVDPVIPLRQLFAYV